LLEKSPKDRLTDPQAIKSHSWYSGIDFEKLTKKELEPPIRPAMGNLENFSKELTRENIDQLDLEEGSDEVDEKLFDNFAFARPSYFGEIKNGEIKEG